MRVLLLLIFLVIIAPAQLSRDTKLTNDIINFHEHWNKFTRTYFGCPKNATMVEECVVAAGVLDYAEFLAARKNAKKLFGLVEEKK